MERFKIGKKWVGDGASCFIIAEAGSNHNGKLEQAFELIDVAADAGADAVKFQTFRAKNMYPETSGSVEYLKELGMGRPIYDLIKDMEMPFDWIPKLAEHCIQKNIIFLSTPFDEECADRLDPYVPAFKIASYELTHIPLIQHVAKKGKPMILSTGGSTLREVRDALEAVKKVSLVPVALTQCTAKYPAPLGSLNLSTIPLLRNEFRRIVGFSDHSREPLTAPLVALGFGARILEKHYTLSNRLPGPDHAFAIEPHELKALVAAIRQAEETIGDGEKAPHRVESELRNYQRGIFALRDIAAGEKFSADNLAILRRAGLKSTDLAPRDFSRVLQKKATRALQAHALLEAKDVENHKTTARRS